MKILHLYKAYPPVKGGIENTIALLAEGFARRGHEVSVLVSAAGRRTERETVRGVAITRVGRLAEVASTPLSPALPLHLAARRPDIVHLHSPFPPAETANLLVGRARRTVVTYHSDVVRQARLLRLYGPLLRRVLARADAIFPTSAAYVRSSPWLRPVQDRCRVVPLGIDLSRFLTSPRVPAADRFGPGPPVILFVGRFRAYKGLTVLLDALARVDHARAVLVGDGPERPAIEARARARGLTDRVTFAGSVSDAELPGYYAAADLFVLPSTHRSEAFGLVQVEAMASGLPVVCTELGTGTSEVNRHGETGLVVPPGDPAALAAACQRLLTTPAERTRLGQAARTRAAQEFTAEAYLDRTEAEYQRVLGR